MAPAWRDASIESTRNMRFTRDGVKGAGAGKSEPVAGRIGWATGFWGCGRNVMGRLVEIRQADQTVAVARFKVESMMDRREIEQVWSDLSELIESGWVKTLVLDFKHVKYLSSQAIGIVMAVHNKLKREQKGKVILCSLIPSLLKLLQLVRMDKVVSIEPALEEALKKATGRG